MLNVSFRVEMAVNNDTQQVNNSVSRILRSIIFVKISQPLQLIPGIYPRLLHIALVPAGRWISWRLSRMRVRVLKIVPSWLL